MPPRPVLTATYRLQFRQGVDFAAARRLVPYLHDLGISHLYASPVMQARAGSVHGYDVVDPNRLDPALGGEEQFGLLISALRQRGMGLIVDTVPNHQAADSANPAWMDVLAKGRRSPHSAFFDIRWIKTRDRGEVFLVPALAAPLQECLRKGTLIVTIEESSLPDGAAGFAARAGLGETPGLPPAGLSRPALPRGWGFFLRHHDQRYPIAAEAWPLLYGGEGLEDLRRKLADLNDLAPDRREPLIRRLMAAGPYRLIEGIAASRHYAYRRFFDISGLVGVRVEDRAVFDQTHELILRLVREGKVDGLRIDHIDGLLDPSMYLQELRRQAGPDCYIVAEKILGRGERLRPDWPVDGTTGYEFMNATTTALIDPRGLAAIGRTQARWSGERTRFGDLAYEGKRTVLREMFAGEAADLRKRLFALIRDADPACPIPRSDLDGALTGVTCSLAVYRTYVRDLNPDPEDLGLIRAAFAAAAGREPGPRQDAVRYLEELLTLNPGNPVVSAKPEAALDFVMRWQQLTGPLAAKGVEDTALYRDNRLIALDEVGSDTSVPCAAVEQLHARNREARERWPKELNATSTHDSKRSEDVRARLAVLAEIPEEWSQRLARWAEGNTALRAELDGRMAPDAREEALIYQTLVGAWPLDAIASGDSARTPCSAEPSVGGFVDRVRDYLVKALREAKTHSGWAHIGGSYEEAVVGFVERIVDDDRFCCDAAGFVGRIAWFGAVNSLSQLVLKCVSPGVPDFYQGCETWDFSLTDPDNRRPVDFVARAELLAWLGGAGPRAGRAARELLDGWRDGSLKLHVMKQALAVRRDDAQLFDRGDYVEVQPAGEKSNHLIVVARRLDDRWLLAAVPRLPAGVSVDPGLQGGAGWGGTSVVVPVEAPSVWRDVMTGRSVALRPKSAGAGTGAVAGPGSNRPHSEPGGGVLLARELFDQLPVSILVGSVCDSQGGRLPIDEP